MARYLSGRSVRLTHTFLDDEETLTPVSVTVTVTRAGGTVSTADGEATGDAGVYTFDAGQLAPGAYTVRWDGGAVAVDITIVEVVGGFLFTVPQLRASDEDLTAQRFPADEVRLCREVVEAEFQRITGRSFTPRTAFLAASDFPECGELLPFRDVASVAALGASPGPLTVETVGPYAFMPEVPDGTTGLEVVYGFPAVPAGVKRAALLYARWLLLEERSSIPDRATSFQPAEGGTYTLSTPGRAGAETGLPTVDAVLEGYRYRIAESVVIG
ncbi:hypothetical protein GCM10029963_28420 [Micromonospora andamanensis]|uniref:hypothetical protein n=1 Tax=Micromonospora andamanensis TaxID=1287068 RepID=UPI00194E3F29|nr:hypothetical protein [Micromonospora andamanensis]GIJ38525.1 hypothetical protein Vwe01_18500 [Micromonospora andamanensis]